MTYTPWLKTEIIVTQADQLSWTLDSTKLYRIDWMIDMWSIEITVPEWGLFLEWVWQFTSALYSTANNHTLFKTSTYSWDVDMRKLTTYTTWTGSKILDLDNQWNWSTFELDAVNIWTFAVETTSIWKLSNYRQLRTNNVAFIRVADWLTFSWTWLWWFRIAQTIALNIPANTTLFKEWTLLDFQWSSFTDMNSLSIDDTAVVFDFQNSNFSADSWFLANSFRTNINSNSIPNLTTSSTKTFFTDCRGVKNTRIWCQMVFSSQATTVIPWANTPVKANGTTTTQNEIWMNQTGNNEITYNSTLETDVEIFCDVTIDWWSNDDIRVIIRKWDNNLSSYTDVSSSLKNINNVIWWSDVAYYNFFWYTELNLNDRIEIWLENTSDWTDVTLLVDGKLNINAR